MFERKRQRRWDDKSLVTVSTHLTRKEYDRMQAILKLTGQTMYGALQAALREAISRSEATLGAQLQDSAEKYRNRLQ